MARTRKTDEDRELNAFIGSRVQAFRVDGGLNLEELGGRLGISAPHLKSLESGRYSFSAALLCRLSAALGRPVDAFLPLDDSRGAPGAVDAHRTTWEHLYDALTVRDRAAVLQLGQALAGQGGLSLLQTWKRLATRSGQLVALEGVDGVILDHLADAVARRLAKAGSDPFVSRYDFDSALWQFMVPRFRALEPGPTHAFERSLLYACERLSRQEQQIRPHLQTGGIVITQFFALASVAYQQVEKLTDTALLEAVEGFLLEPDLVVLVESDPAEAARRAVPERPGQGQFYSPYTGLTAFSEALRRNREAAVSLGHRAIPVLPLQDDGDIDRMADAVFEALK